MTTRAARLEGGTTKFVPWTTSTAPMNRSMRGWLDRVQATVRGRAAIGRCSVPTPAGTALGQPTAAAEAHGVGRRSSSSGATRRSSISARRHADPGVAAEQRRAVERHAQPARPCSFISMASAEHRTRPPPAGAPRGSSCALIGRSSSPCSSTASRKLGHAVGRPRSEGQRRRGSPRPSVGHPVGHAGSSRSCPKCPTLARTPAPPGPVRAPSPP